MIALLAAAAALAIQTPTFAQPAPAAQVDALTPAPDNFRLVLENERARAPG